MNSSIQTTIDIGFVPSLEIETALANLDGERVLRAANLGLSLEDYYDTVRAHTLNRSVTAFRGKAVTAIRNSALVMIPVIVFPENLARTDGTKVCLSNDSVALLAGVVAEWSPRPVRVVMSNDLLSYAEISRYDPVHLRHVLNQLSPDEETYPSALRQEEFWSCEYRQLVPEDFPRLHFLFTAITRQNSLPLVPSAMTSGSGVMFQKIEQALRFELAGTSDFERSIQVIVPEVDNAVEAGVTAWLSTINDKYKIGRWDAVPQSGDRVDIYLELEESSQSSLVIPIRTYQVGIKGVERIIHFLGSLGSACVEYPNASKN